MDAKPTSKLNNNSPKPSPKFLVTKVQESAIPKTRPSDEIVLENETLASKRRPQSSSDEDELEHAPRKRLHSGPTRRRSGAYKGNVSGRTLAAPMNKSLVNSESPSKMNDNNSAVTEALLPATVQKRVEFKPLHVDTSVNLNDRNGSVSCNSVDESQVSPRETDSDNDTLTQSSVTRLLSIKFMKKWREYAASRPTIEEEPSPADTTEPPKPLNVLSSKFESMDYDVCENALYVKDQQEMKSWRIQMQYVARWIVAFLIGVGTALVAVFIEVSIDYISEYKHLGVTKQSCIHTQCLAYPLLALVAMNSVLVAAGAALVTYLEPNAAGSSIPQVKCYLNGVKIPGLLTVRALIAKAPGVILSVTGGLACGKEGPMIHSGAIVAAGISQGRSKLLNTDFKIFEYLRSDHERRDFVSAGAAAGVSAAFGAPVGGVLFSLEEGASFWNQNLTWRMVFASFTASFGVNILVSAIHGQPSELSHPGLISFGLFNKQDTRYEAIEMPIFIAMAILGGILGAAFVHLNYLLTLFRKKYVQKKWQKVIEATCVAGMSGVVMFTFLYASSDCQKLTVKDSKTHSLVQMWCPDGQYSSISTIALVTPEAALKNMFHMSADTYSQGLLIVFVIVYFLLACWTYGLSVSSGIFIPSLLIGATWGRLIGIGVNHMYPDQVSSLGKYALIGAAAHLGGTVRMTISLTVILVECTGDITFGLPLLIVLLIAKWVADFFNTGIYDLHIMLMGIPILPCDPPPVCSNIPIKEVMHSPVIVFKPIETVGSIVDVLRTCTHNGFPVVDSSKAVGNSTKSLLNLFHGKRTFGTCRGLILRSHLLLLLKHRVYKDGSKLSMKHFRNMYKLSHVEEVDIDMFENDRECRVDLRAYMNPSPHTVFHNVSLPRTFQIFRGIGLRHLVVVSDDNRVMGMVTRKELAKFRTLQKQGLLKILRLQIQDK